jgi:hypothetical protein
VPQLSELASPAPRVGEPSHPQQPRPRQRRPCACSVHAAHVQCERTCLWTCTWQAPGDERSPVDVPSWPPAKPCTKSSVHGMLASAWATYLIEVRRGGTASGPPRSEEVRPLWPESCPPLRCTPLRCTPLRCTPLRCTPLRCTPLSCTPLSCTPLRCTPLSCTPLRCTPLRRAPP